MSNNLGIKQRLLRVAVVFLFIFCVFSAELSAVEITDEAQKIYKQSQSAVYQIQVINLSTDKKTSLGSGFQFTPEGHLATNYHVVSYMLNEPNQYRVEYISNDGQKGLLNIIDVDVVHDLAILEMVPKKDAHLSLGNSEMDKGTKIFSMGNPHDLGMTVIEGIYNGLMEKSLYRKILFSGSLNPGMSGGPALDHNGQVIGVNVSTQGNEISFLVPVEFLKAIYENLKSHGEDVAQKWPSRAQDQLIENQNNLMVKFNSPNWNLIKLGETTVPGEISNIFKCWGGSQNKEKDLYKSSFVQCSSEDEIFLSPNLYTGQVIYKYLWVTSNGLNPIRFYHLYQNFYSHPQEYNNAAEDDVANFECETNFVNIDNNDFKATLCVRNYKKFPRLYDANFSLVSVDKKDRGLMVEIVGLGVLEDKFQELIKRFMQEIKWQK